MPQKIAVRNPDDFVVTVGTEIIKGFAPKKFAQWDPVEDIITYEAGIDGEVVITRNGNKVTEISLFLQESSDSNDYLTQIATLMESAPAGAGGIVPFGLVNKNGRDHISSINCAVKRWPSASFEANPTTREWKIVLFHTVVFLGGATYTVVNT